MADDQDQEALMSGQMDDADAIQESEAPKSNNRRDPDTGERIGNFYGHKRNDLEDADAREENCFQSLGRFCCPKIRITQFIVIITLIELVIFIITCSIYGLSNSDFLAPATEGISWGWSDVKKIRNEGQVWRFFTPTLLHGHLEHIMGNFLGQLFMGTGIEDGIGVIRVIILYFLGGLGGILFSMDIRPYTHGVGASTAIFGLVGFYIAYIFSNFYYMNRIRCGQLVFLIVYCSIMVLMNLNLGPHSDSHVDNWGHLGGLITGLLTGFALTEWYDWQARQKERVPDRFTRRDYERKSACCSFFHYFCTVILVLWFIALFTVFYLIDVDSLPDDDDDN